MLLRMYLSFSGKDDDNAKKDELFSRSYNKLCIQKKIEAPLVFFAAHITWTIYYAKSVVLKLESIPYM